MVLRLVKFSKPSILLIWFADKSKCFRFLKWNRFSILWMKLLCRFRTWIWGLRGIFWRDLMPESIRHSSVLSKSILFIAVIHCYPLMISSDFVCKIFLFLSVKKYIHKKLIMIDKVMYHILRTDAIYRYDIYGWMGIAVLFWNHQLVGSMFK